MASSLVFQKVSIQTFRNIRGIELQPSPGLNVIVGDNGQGKTSVLEALYLVATRVEKYVGKIAVDSFFVRFGDVLSAGVVYLGAKLALPTQVFAAINLVLVLLWMFVVVLVGREHRRRSEDLEKEGAAAHPEPSPATS